ncbi:PEP-CTERM sorting domain-containing protein [Geomonas sp. Red32]|uniref:PEP-CTERM sorting domain-containing protein n=1 Tax=Geomonas sp. Red32 TaxID=2912856 RepID=UPI00202CC311|nr:PEP-CTERM sorting domain-containing protein [Geomonas sp. Red32]MCM0082949.1 PEP-CTERM sorting domain-containing protein [Geomonas sp. Red32]
MKCKLSVIAGLGLLASLALPMGASATPILGSETLTIGVGNAELVNAGYLGPYATLQIDLLTPKTAMVTMTGLDSYMLGGGGSVALNTGGGSATATNFSWTGGKNSGGGIHTGYASPQSGGGVVSDFGHFNLKISGNGAYSCAVDSLTFTLTDTSSTLWNSVDDVLVANADGYEAGAHIFTKDGVVSGFAGNGGDDPAPVPEPGTMMMLGAGVLSLAIYGKRRRNV